MLRPWPVNLFAILLLTCATAWGAQSLRLVESTTQTQKDKGLPPCRWEGSDGTGVSAVKSWHDRNQDKNFSIKATFSWKGIPGGLEVGSDVPLTVKLEQFANNETGYDPSIKIYYGTVGGSESDGPVVTATWRKPRSVGQDTAVLRVPQLGSGKRFYIRVFCKVAGDNRNTYYFYSATGGKTSGALLNGTWSGPWSNDLGESGTETLQLTEDSHGKLSGVWSGVAVTGRRLGPSEFELHCRTDKREYRVNGTISASMVVLRYVAVRLDGPGSYKGISRLNRR